MKNILRNPMTNALGISVFTAFYASIFFVTAGQPWFIDGLSYRTAEASHPFWTGWCRFLAAGHHRYIAIALIIVAILVVIMHILRHKPYDEYQTSILVTSLMVSFMLTLAAIGGFFLLVLMDPNGIWEKYTLFIVAQWTTVTLSDLVYTFLCRWG